MALKPYQREVIQVAYTTNYFDAVTNPNGLSNRAIAKEAQCSESAVRTAIKKLIEKNVEKNGINALAKTEVHTTIIQEQIDQQKDALTPAEKNAYKKVFDTAKKTIDVATNYQSQLLKRQEFDNETIDAIVVMKGEELKTAKTPEEILRVNLKYREYIGIIVDPKEIKDAIEANDKAMITKGEAPRHAPKADGNTYNTLINDTAEGTKGKF